MKRLGRFVAIIFGLLVLRSVFSSSVPAHTRPQAPHNPDLGGGKLSGRLSCPSLVRGLGGVGGGQCPPFGGHRSPHRPHRGLATGSRQEPWVPKRRCPPRMGSRGAGRPRQAGAPSPGHSGVLTFWGQHSFCLWGLDMYFVASKGNPGASRADVAGVGTQGRKWEHCDVIVPYLQGTVGARGPISPPSHSGPGLSAWDAGLRPAVPDPGPPYRLGLGAGAPQPQALLLSPRIPERGSEGLRA